MEKENDNLNDDVKALRKKISGYKGFIKLIQSECDSLRTKVAKHENEAIRNATYIRSLEKSIRELTDANNKTLVALNEANDEVTGLKKKLEDIYEMPWYKRIFI